MKNNIPILLLFLFLFSCKKEKNSIDFTTDSIIYSGESTNLKPIINRKVKSVTWKVIETGEKFEISSPDPFAYVFPKKGTYTIELTADFKVGKSVTITKQIEVLAGSGWIKYWRSDMLGMYSYVDITVTGTDYSNHKRIENYRGPNSSGASCEYQGGVSFFVPGGTYSVTVKDRILPASEGSYTKVIEVDGNCVGI